VSDLLLSMDDLSGKRRERQRNASRLNGITAMTHKQ